MKYKKEEYLELLDLAINRAHNSLKHFFDLLDIDSELFIDLFKTEILVDHDKLFVDCDNCAIAFMGNPKYDACVFIGLDYLDDELDKIKKTNQKQNSINDIAASIIHELLHINRGIIINNKDNYKNYCYLKWNVKDKLTGSIIKDNLDTSLYDKLLDDVIKNNHYSFFDDIIPLKLSFNNGLYDVVAYSKKDNAYLFYHNEAFSFKDNKDPLLYIGLELNSEEFDHEPSYTYLLTKDYNNNEMIDPSQYIHQNNTDSLEKKNKKIDYQLSFEETLVETLTQIILRSRKSNTLDLDSLNNFFDSCHVVEESLMFKIIKRKGIEFIKWYLFSCRKEYYDDKLYEIFNDKYDSILKSFDKLRYSTLNDEKYNNDEVNNINEIIDEKIIKKIK